MNIINPFQPDGRDLIPSCMYRLVFRLVDSPRKNVFFEKLIPCFSDWLLSLDIDLTEHRGLLSTRPLKKQSERRTYDGYLDFVRSSFSEKFKKLLPQELRKCSKDELEFAAALIQLSMRPRDHFGYRYVENYLREDEIKDFERRIEEANQDAKFFLEKLKPHITRYRDIAKRPRNPKLKDILTRLVVEKNSTNPKILWLSLIRKFHDKDPEICDFFDNLVADDTGLSNQNSLKEAPYKFIYMDSVQSGNSKGQEKFLTYSKFRYHVRKTKK